jgi:hypothetical protein
LKAVSWPSIIMRMAVDDVLLASYLQTTSTDGVGIYACTS